MPRRKRDTELHDGPLHKQKPKAGLDLSALLGKSTEDIEEEEKIIAETNSDLINSLFSNYGNMHVGRNEFIRELNQLETDEQLIAFVEEHFHIRIPYVAVCEDHQSPGQAFCDVFYNRAPEALWWASRASFKSFGTGLLTVLDTVRYKLCETKILAGSQEQGNNVYAAATTHVYAAGLDNVFKMRRNFTTAENGSSFSVLTASPKSARGPHPQRLKLDEVDEIPPEIYEAAVNQPMAKHGVPMQTLMTSTMHKVYGLMSEIVDNASTTKLRIYKWCYKEVTMKCHEPDCRKLEFSQRFRGEACPLLGEHVERMQDVNEEERGRLIAADTYVINPDEEFEEGEKEYVSGFFDGSCQGGLRRASGYVPVDDQRAARQRVPKHVWEVENECRRPTQEDMVYDPVLLMRGTVQDLDWNSEISEDRTWAMCDWGYNNPTVLLLGQDMILPGKKLQTGKYHHCITNEFYWTQRGLNWRVDQICNILEDKNIRQFYADGENVDALMAMKEEMAKRRYRCLIRGVPFNRFKEILIETVRHDMETGHWFISGENCPETIKSLYKLHYRENTEDVAKEEDHGPDAMLAGWRRFLRANDLSMTTGYDVGSVMTMRELVRTGMRADIPGISRGSGTEPKRLHPGSHVGIAKKKQHGGYF